MSTSIDLKTLLGTKSTVSEFTDTALDSLLASVNNFQVNVDTSATNKDIFGCAISLNDVLDFDLDFFNLNKSTPPNYILLNKIRILRRLIQSINNTFIKIIKDLDCCTSDDMYNKMVVPIFKWLVEDENGLCGILLRMAKELNTIYIPLKNILCLFRPIPGNPTISAAGADFLKFVYPIVEGLEKITNVLENGRFLDILIVPIKTFHDKLIACSNGENVDLYDGSYMDFVTVNGIITDTIHAELNEALLDTLKTLKGDVLSKNSKLPSAPIYKKVTMDSFPRFQDYPDTKVYQAAILNWNERYYDLKKASDRDYEAAYGVYLNQMKDYKQSEFLKDFNLGTSTIQNNSLALDLNSNKLKDTHRAMCGCIAEFAGMDGLFLPKDVIIRSEYDLNALRKRVLYKGISGSDYYTENNKKKIKIIDTEEIVELRKQPVDLDLQTRITYSLVSSPLMARINSVQTLGDVLDLHNKFIDEKNTISRKYVSALNNYQSVELSLKNKYKEDLKDINLEISYINTEINQGGSSPELKLKLDQALSRRNAIFEFPPRAWVMDPNSDLVKTNGDTYSYQQYLSLSTEITDIKKVLDDYDMAIKRLHTTVQVVNSDPIECSCDLICMIVKYIINTIMTVIKKLIMYLVSYIAGAMINKELQWWLAFISAKIQCIIDLIAIPKNIEDMRTKFENELEYAKGSIRELSQSSSCKENNSSVIKNFNLNKDKVKLGDTSFPDIKWGDGDDPYQTDTTITSGEFNITTKNVTFETNDWKNRTIPTTVMNCEYDHSVIVDWTPSSPIWSIFMNININPEQFNSSDEIDVTTSTTNENDIIQSSYKDLLWKLLTSAQTIKNFDYRIETENGVVNLNSDFVTLDESNLTLMYGGAYYPSDKINKLWFSNAYSTEMVLVFSRTFEEDLKSVYSIYTDQIKSNINDILNPDTSDGDLFSSSNSKICSPTNLTISKWEPLYSTWSLSILTYQELLNMNLSSVTNILFKGKIEGTAAKMGDRVWVEVNFIKYETTLLDDLTFVIDLPTPAITQVSGAQIIVHLIIDGVEINSLDSNDLGILFYYPSKDFAGELTKMDLVEADKYSTDILTCGEVLNMYPNVQEVTITGRIEGYGIDIGTEIYTLLGGTKYSSIVLGDYSYKIKVPLETLVLNKKELVVIYTSAYIDGVGTLIDNSMELESVSILSMSKDFQGNLEKYIFTPTPNLIKSNIPFLLTLKNGSGTEFKLIVFIDICLPNNIMNTSYDRAIDGVYLNGRYDYFEFDSIPNNKSKVYYPSQIIKKLKGYLVKIGMISSTTPGVDLGTTLPTGVVESGDNEDNVIASDLNKDDFPTNLNGDVLNNLPDGPLKNKIIADLNKASKITELLKDTELIIGNLTDGIEGKINGSIGLDSLDNSTNDVVKNLTAPFKNQKLGIPILVLNEEKDIVLTIHQKKLKLININNGLLNSELKLETGEIQLNPGENLFIEFSTNGFEYTIGWTNDRKMSERVSIVSTVPFDLKPTYVGSLYRSNSPVALLCGKLNDLVITTKNNDPSDWYNYSNTYRPSGTIGYYDFSLFDGYHVFSLPPKFNTYFADEIDTFKNKLYESNNTSQAEIDKYIQLGNYSALKDKTITVVGERPISVGGDFSWKNNVYYKNVSFGYLENFFCRDNLKGKPFTISCWLREKNPETYNKTRWDKMYIFSDTNNGNFIWMEDSKIHFKFKNQVEFDQPLTTLFKKNIFSTENDYVEKWFHHVFRYDINNAMMYYSIECIDQERNFDPNYNLSILEKKEIDFSIKFVNGVGRMVDFSLVSMLARYDMERLKYVDRYSGEIAALAIWNTFLTNKEVDDVYLYQKRIIQNEVI